MIKPKQIVTIGDGIAAWCLHEELLKLDDVEIINISAEDFFPRCTMRTTSINCLRGTRRGVAKQGDLIIDAHDEFLKFYNEHRPDGITEGAEYQIWYNNNSENWKRRYPVSKQATQEPWLRSKLNYSRQQSYFKNEDAYFIDPVKLGAWYDKRHMKITKKNGLVNKIDKQKNGYLVSTSAFELNADQVFLCTSYGTELFKENYSDIFKEYISKSKKVAGSYLEINLDQIDLDLGCSDFNLCVEKWHFIYRYRQGVLQIGATSKGESGIQVPDVEGLKDIYSYLKNELNIKMPAFESFSMRAGIRQKGWRRMPYWGRADDSELYVICGLYKNAFRFAYLAAKELVRG